MPWHEGPEGAADLTAPVDLAGRVVLVTGATGFVGRATVDMLTRCGAAVRAVSRRPVDVRGAASTAHVTDLMNADLARLVEGAWGIVNCAARVHRRWERRRDAEAEHARANAEFPLRLAEAAARAGAEHFVQISSLAAVASASAPGETIDDSTAPNPVTPYGRSKLAADLGLLALPPSQMTITCLRPPALLGAEAPGWAPLLARAARAGVPLPLGAVENRRSFMNVTNLAEAIATALSRGPTGAYLVSDSAPVSTADLYAMMSEAVGRRATIWARPPEALAAIGRLALGSRVDSLIGNCACDGARFAGLSGWSPGASLRQGIAALMQGR